MWRWSRSTNFEFRPDCRSAVRVGERAMLTLLLSVVALETAAAECAFLTGGRLRVTPGQSERIATFDRKVDCLRRTDVALLATGGPKRRRRKRVLDERVENKKQASEETQISSTPEATSKETSEAIRQDLDESASKMTRVQLPPLPEELASPGAAKTDVG